MEGKQYMKELIPSLVILFCPFYPLKSKHTYFSLSRRRIYISILFLVFVIEISIFALVIIIFSGILNSTLCRSIAIVFTIFLLVVFLTAMSKLENFSNYLKEQDKKEIRKNIRQKLSEIKARKLNVINFLITLKEENKVIKRTLEDNKEPILTMNLVNTALGVVVGYYLHNIREIAVSSLIFVLIIFFIIYSYLILDITKTSKLYLIELYNCQISYANRLIKMYRK